MSADTESHDDVAGLFKRLGRNDDTRQYHDFSGAPALPGKSAKVKAPSSEPAPAPTAPPPVPPKVQEPAVSRPLSAPATPAPSASAQVGEGRGTALDALFQRLLEAPLRSSAQSPLARLRAR